MVTNDGEVKVIDFGFSKEVGTDSSETKSISLNWWCDVPDEFKKGVYNVGTDIYFIGQLFENIIKDNKIETFPYKAVLHYSKMLKENGAMIGVLGSDFFDYDKDQEFKKELLETCSIIGLVELPDSIFVSKPKIIAVIQKKVIEDKKNCFMVKLPSFTNVKEFNSSLLEIEAWFEKNNKL